MKGFLLRGLIAGALAGLVAAIFLRLLTETQIGFALQFEDAAGIGAGPGEAPEFTRGVQQVGGMLGALVYGVILGVVVAFVVAAVHHLLAGRNEFQRVAKVCGAAFVAVVLVPSLKYPPNPPTVGNPDTISQRTVSYLLLMTLGIAVTFGAWYLWQVVSARGVDGGARFLVVAGCFVAVVALAYVVFPASPDAIRPPNNEADPTLAVSPDAPDDVLESLLSAAKVNDDESLRDPDDPREPLDVSRIDDAGELRGVPVAVGTDRLVAHGYTSMVWNFRVLSIAGLALMFAVIAGVLGLLLDRTPRSPGDQTASRSRAPVSADG